MARQHVAPVNIPYTSEDKSQRFEIKLTVRARTRTTGSKALHQGSRRQQINNTFSTATSMDLAACTTASCRRICSRSATTASCRRSSSSRRASRRGSSRFIGSGSPVHRPHQGHAAARPRRAATCATGRRPSAACATTKKRDNDNEYVKATYFKSTKGSGSHQMVFGYDTFNDKRFANNHQSGSDYRIIGTTSIVRGTGGCRDLSAVEPGRPRSSSSTRSRSAARARISGRMASSTTTTGASTTTDVQPRRALGQEPRRGRRRQLGREGQRVQPAVRRRLGSEGRRPVDGDRQRRQVRRRAQQQRRRLVVAGRQPGDVAVDLSAARRSTRTRRAATLRRLGRGDSAGVRLVQSGFARALPHGVAVGRVRCRASRSRFRTASVAQRASRTPVGVSRQLGDRGSRAGRLLVSATTATSTLSGST